jgi:hypothetical protein
MLQTVLHLRGLQAGHAPGDAHWRPPRVAARRCCSSRPLPARLAHSQPGKRERTS